MKKQNVRVPEETRTPAGPEMTAEEQTRELLDKLTGHQVFARCRGRIEDFDLRKFLEAPKPSVSQVARRVRAWYEDRQVMIAMLARLKNAGKMLAFDLLHSTLTDPGFVLPGETIPLDKTVDAVLVIPEPDRVLPLARWLMTTRFEHANYWLTHSEANPEHGVCGSLTPKIYKQYPHIQILCSGGRSALYNMDLSIRDHVELLDRLRAEFAETNRFAVRILASSGDLIQRDINIGYIVASATSKQVLEKFHRTEQDNLALWSFRIPLETMYGMKIETGSSHYYVALHPADEHDGWSKLWPAFVSRSTTHGLGAILIDDFRRGHNRRSDSRPVEVYKAVENIHPNYLKGNLKRARLPFGLRYCGD